MVVLFCDLTEPFQISHISKSDLIEMSVAWRELLSTGSLIKEWSYILLWYDWNTFGKSCENRILHENIDQTLINSLHGLLNCEIGGLDCHVSTTEYSTCPLYTHVTPILWCIGLCNLFKTVRSMFSCNTLIWFAQSCLQISLVYFLCISLQTAYKYEKEF